MDNVIYERYRELACTSIAFAINEYLAEPKTELSDAKFIHWVYECEWFDLLPINRELVIRKVTELKKIGLRKIYYADIWKGYKERKKWQKEK